MADPREVLMQTIAGDMPAMGMNAHLGSPAFMRALREAEAMRDIERMQRGQRVLQRLNAPSPIARAVEPLDAMRAATVPPTPGVNFPPMRPDVPPQTMQGLPIEAPPAAAAAPVPMGDEQAYYAQALRQFPRPSDEELLAASVRQDNPPAVPRSEPPKMPKPMSDDDLLASAAYDLNEDVLGPLPK